MSTNDKTDEVYSCFEENWSCWSCEDFDCEFYSLCCNIFSNIEKKGN